MKNIRNKKGTTMKNIRNKKIANLTVEEFIQLIKSLKENKDEDEMDVLELKNTSKSDKNEEPEQYNTEIVWEITNLLHTLGITANLNGYKYIRSSILLALEKPDVLNGTSTILYSTISIEYNTFPERVERGIWYAINVSWNRGNLKKFEQTFGYTVNNNKRKPTNSQFIFMLVDYLKLKYNI